jgi:NADH-quinone oxidoreductase subunit I
LWNEIFDGALKALLHANTIELRSTGQPGAAVHTSAFSSLTTDYWPLTAGTCYARRVMGMQSLFRKVFLIDLLQGLKVTFRYQDPKEIYTEQYPMERPQVAERYRGAPRLNVNPDTDETMCIACDLCALACPENLIVVSSARNEQTRRKELTNFTYDLSRCMFCGLCEDACPVDALELTQDFELASYTREGWIWDRETLEKGPSPTQYRK